MLFHRIEHRLHFCTRSVRLYLVTFCLGEHRSHLVPEVGLNFKVRLSCRRSGKGMVNVRFKLEYLKRRWEEDDHRQLVRLEAAGDRTYVAFHRERKLRRFIGSARDLQLTTTKEGVRVIVLSSASLYRTITRHSTRDTDIALHYL